MKQLFLFIFIPLYVFGQSPTGGWRSHLPMGGFKWMGELPGYVLAANEHGVLVYDRTESSVEELTKISYLSQTGISCFECEFDQSLCVIGYTNGSLDFLYADKSVINQPAILVSNIVGDKRINSVFFQDNIAVLSTGLGIVTVNLSTRNIGDYVQVRWNEDVLNILQSTIVGERIYILTDKGVFYTNYASLFSEPTWTQLMVDASIENVTSMFTFKNDLYLINAVIENGGDTLLKLSEGVFSPIPELAGMELSYVSSSSEKLIVTHRYEVVEYDSNFNPLRKVFTYSSSPGMDAQSAIFDRTNNAVLIADALFGGVICNLDDQFSSILFSRSSPRTALLSKLDYFDDKLFAMPGGNDFTFNLPYLFSLESGQWTTQLLFAGENNFQRNTSGIVNNGDLTYVGFDGGGLVVLDKDLNIVSYYDESNAEIEDDVDGYYGVKGLEVDDQNNVWMLNSRATSTLSVVDPEGNWTLINLPDYPKPIADNFMRHSTGIFVFSLKDNGLILYDPGDTPTDLSDDQYVSITTSPTNGRLPNNTVNSLVEDRDGELWIGTDQGIGVIYNPQNMFGANPEDVQKIIVNQDGFNGYLFESDVVEAMAVDGANRKWVAPRGGGLFLISADGQEQLLRFSSESSPLLSDNINDVLVHPVTGEVFIASEGGLHSYRGDATEPAETMSQLKAFPNPVKPGFGGVVTISGFSEDSNVRITDAAGNLVFETVSRGGTATWDIKDNTGTRVTSGIYLVFGAAGNGLGGAITKLMILN